MTKKLTEDNKVLIYVLATNSNRYYSQSKIAEIFSVSQGTISSVVKEMGYKVTLYDMRASLEKAKKEAVARGYLDTDV
jgi:predicted XRE-type DNA-binding protein